MNRSLAALVAVVIILAGRPGPCRAGDDELIAELPRIAPLAPAEALASFRLRPSFELAQVAAEPIVTDPVSACFDADGRLYVVEMRGYPYPENTPNGNVRLLVDADGDGNFERSTIFVDGLSWPTSVLPYDGGVFIAVAPRILYAKDTNGDGVADVNTTIFQGFGVQNVQALVNGLSWGPDGWIYGVSGGNGGAIESVAKPGAAVVDLHGRDFRFRPDGSGFQAVSGGGQFGHSFDDWGHRFTCNNSNHIRQIVLPSNYLERNPSLVVSGVIADIAVEGPASPVYRVSRPEPWRVVRTRQRVADPEMLKRLAPTERFAAGFFTSATGITIYRGSAYGESYRGDAFIGDVGGNLVHRKVLAPQGSIYQATRAEPDRKDEFLASTDTWFRPVNFANTPGGTLLMLDMYRETIEHPYSIPDPIKRHLDLTSGKDKGRLYEIRPVGFSPRKPPRLGQATTADLVTHLGDTDAWWRETSQRLLIERRDPNAPPLLKALAQRRPNAYGRTHALWTLNILRALEPATLIPAFTDADARVREQAAKLGEEFADDPRITELMLALADDPDAMVRFQAAFSLGDVKDSRAAKALAAIASKDRADPWTRLAVLSALTGRLGAFVDALRDDPTFIASEEGRSWLAEVAEMAGHGGKSAEIAEIVAITGDDTTPLSCRFATAIGLDRGMRRRGKSLRTELDGQDSFATLLKAARASALSESLDPPLRVVAVRVVGLGDEENAVEILADLLDARQPIELQRAALQTLSGLADSRVAESVLSHWKSFGPSVRPEAIEVLFAKPERLRELLGAIEAHEFAPGDLDSVRREQLRKHADPKIQERAAALLGSATNVSRRAALAEARPSLELSGDAAKGRAVFDRVCATCHKAEGRGEAVGPELATVAGRTPEELLTHVLDPNREVLPQYVNYILATTDGQVLSGRIVSETAGAVTLGRAGGVIEVVPRGRIEALSSTGLSLMPDGLESGLTHQEMADLFAFVRALQPADSNPPAK
jgi:putative membrane-bound dehydrogenase-like protein